MKSMKNGRVVPDEDVLFYDEIIYIICDEVEGFSCHQLVLCPQYDGPTSLLDIAEKYPNVRKVIAESYLKGQIFNYNNHPKEDEKWELVGETIGFV
jgi:hypothetical protein